MISDAEARVREAWDRRDFVAATTATLHAYGPEILGLLVALQRDHDAAGEAFSAFAEKLWTTMERFEWKCSMRTWAYLLARRASHDVFRRERPSGHKKVPLSQAPEISALVERVRTQTLSALADAKIEAFAELRRELPEEEQTLLVLRIDRDLSWDELAHVFLQKDAPSADELKRESARLRKRFQMVKEKLRELGRKRGLLARS